MCRSIDARAPNSKILRFAKFFSKDQLQVKDRNIVLYPVGQVPQDKKEVNKIDKRMVHNCRTSSLGDPIFYHNFSMQEMGVTLEAMDCRKSPGPDNIHGQMVKHLADKGKDY
ncbi:hypothetical protein TNIN_245741 [Trichonephila inaurata madagascariensis]|uniref:Uncharacterized protein n=1 Tax=Trichonephila inaurata madagascariensis TaxID=2747483 RepID=A0A8X7CUC0_9ARAC|nr:hypothetical protein TNIN_245741 [Trichonephila inaurata madagascariensis]